MRPVIRKTTVPAGESAIKQRTQNAQGQADVGQLHSTEPVCQPARDDDEDAGEQGGDADRDVGQALADPQLIAHRRARHSAWSAQRARR